MAKTKYGNKTVYACPECWVQGLDPWSWFCGCGGFDSSKVDKPEIFDSKVEYTRGQELKALEAAGEIMDLKHHKKFKLCPELFLSRYHYFDKGKNLSSKEMYSSENQSIIISKGDNWLFLTAINNKDYPASFKSHNAITYESDFTYTMKGEKVVEEAKKLTRIGKTINKTTAAKQKITQTVKVDFPYFTSDEDFRHFRKICQLMFAIHNHRVQVRAGGQLWIFNEDGELERKVKNA